MRSLTFCGGGCSDQQQPQPFPRIASQPSQTMSGRTAKAEMGSAHFTCQIALIANPAKAMSERQAHSADCAASALNVALPVAPDSRRFSLASHGMTAAAAIKIAIPRNVGLGSLWPSRLVTEVTATNAASANNKAPATRAARFSACSFSTLARNLHSTTIAEKNSMALSPPKASSTGLRARQAAKRETAASTLIQPIVTVCTLRIRREVSGEAIWSADAIHSIMAPYTNTETQESSSSSSNDG
jgi:hypothetical protein